MKPADQFVPAIILRTVATISSTRLSSFALTVVLVATAHATSYKVINNFTALHAGPLITDAAGNLYGTDHGGHPSKTCGCGTVFKLSTNSSGGYSKTILYTFLGGSDGQDPTGPLVFDASGNLYGTTFDGGTFGAGTVFKLSSSSGGSWTKQILYDFTGTSDGASPNGGLVFDTVGNIYGTTDQGGIESGVVFELSTASGGTWTETILHTFTYGTDGGYPEGNLIFDAAGNLYGTTTRGGSSSCESDDGCGVVFEFSPSGAGGYSYNVIHTFVGTDGFLPNGQMVFDSAGNLYGATAVGGNLHGCDGSGCGTVFELSPQSGGGWNESVLYRFKSSDGAYAGPGGTLVYGIVRDVSGNLYGTAYSGGADSDGVVFKLSQTAGTWKETVLHSFTGGAAGASPETNVIIGPSGTLIGTTTYGGNLSACTQYGTGCGGVFELTP